MLRRLVPFVLMFAVFLLSACELPFLQGTPTAIQEPLGDEPVGSFNVGSQGGIFQRGKVQISVPPSETDVIVEIAVTITEEASETVYQLDGPLDQIDGPLTITLPIPEEILADGPITSDEHSSEAYIEMETDVFAPSLDSNFLTTIPLPSQIDSATGTITTTLASQVTQANHLGPAKLGSLIPPDAGLLLAEEDYNVSFRVVSGSVRYAWTDHFYVTYSPSESDAAIYNLLETFEGFRSDLISRSFNFGDYREHQLNVYIQAQTKNNADGYLNVPRFWGDPSIVLNASLVIDPNASKNLKATAGHELFHLVHYVTHGFDSDFEWLDEAAAMWYEPIAVGDPGWIPDVMTKYSELYKTSLFHPGSVSRRSIGYYGGYFTRFLGIAFPGVVEETYRLAPDMENGAKALQQTLSPFGTTAGLEWPSFISAYLINPSGYIPGANTPLGYYRKVALVAEDVFTTGNTMDALISFTPGVPGRPNSGTWVNETHLNFQSQEGFLSAEPPSMNLSVDLDSLTGEAILISIYPDDPTKAAFELPGEITVTVQSPDNSGVLVFAVPIGGSIEAATPIAGPPFGFLSSGHPGNPDTATISGFSHADGKGQFDRVVLIPFNSEDGTNLNHPSTVQLTVTYQPALPVFELQGYWEEVDLIIEDAGDLNITFPTTFPIEEGVVNVRWDFANQLVSGDISGHLSGENELPEAPGLIYSFDQVFEGTIEGPTEGGMDFYNEVPVQITGLGYGRTEMELPGLGAIWAQNEGSTSFIGTLQNEECGDGILYATLSFESDPENTDLTISIDIPDSIKSSLPSEMLNLLTPTEESYTRTYGWTSEVIFEIPEEILPFVPGCEIPE